MLKWLKMMIHYMNHRFQAYIDADVLAHLHLSSVVFYFPSIFLKLFFKKYI